MKLPDRKMPRILRMVGTFLIVIGIADASELFDKGSLLEVVVFPYIWLIGAALIISGYIADNNHGSSSRKSKKDHNLEIEAQIKKPW